MAFARTRSEPQGSAPERPFDFSLALARTLVELNHGSLDAEPVGDRVAFVVRLPTVEPSDQATLMPGTSTECT